MCYNIVRGDEMDIKEISDKNPYESINSIFELTHDVDTPYSIIISLAKKEIDEENNLYYYPAWCTKNDKLNKYEWTYYNVQQNAVMEMEIENILLTCDRYIILHATQTIVVWQDEVR